jgi:hypothetical protein
VSNVTTTKEGAVAIHPIDLYGYICIRNIGPQVLVDLSVQVKDRVIDAVVG